MELMDRFKLLIKELRAVAEAVNRRLV